MAIDWQNTSDAIKDNFKKRKLYFNGYTYGSQDDFLYGVVPIEPKSFKPKVLNILIIGTNYGHTDTGFDFAPIIAAIDESKSKLHKDEFVAYETWIYVDLYSASLDTDTTYLDSLTETGAALETFCIDNPELGIIFKRYIFDADNVDSITQEINDWYKSIASR